MPATRSHFLGSCHTCRRRHVRCDRERPSCSKCRSLGVPCEGFSDDVRWVSCNEQNNSSVSSENDRKGMRRYLYSEKSRLSMSAGLGEDLISGSVDVTLAQIDQKSQTIDQPDTGDLVVGPFSVLSFNRELSDQAEPSRVESGGVSTPVPELVTSVPVSVPGVAPIAPLTDPVSYMDDFLHWSDILGLELDNADFSTWPATTTLDELDSAIDDSNLLSTGENRETASSIPIPWSDEQVLSDPGHLPWTPAAHPAGEGHPQHAVDVLTDAPFLLKHLQAKVAPLMVAMPLGKKSPWTMLNIPAAVVTLGDLTFMSAGNITHARLANLYSLLACSATHLTLQPSLDTDRPVEHWQRVTNQAFTQAKEQMQLTLKNELEPPNKAKYKDQLMALCALTEFAIISGQQDHARCLLLDSERLVRLRGLVKRKISQKARLLHHVYTWHRIVGESTYVLHDYTPSKAFLDALQTNFQTPQPEESIRHPDEPSPRLDNFLRLGTSPSDRDLNIDEQKDQATSLQDIHLQDSRDYPETLYKQIYGIPETWLSLLSQTTRLANVMETFQHARQSVDNLSFDAYEALHRRSVRLEYMICSLASRYSDTNDQSNPAHHIFRALNTALLIFFYHRIRNVHPLLLQHHIDTTISGLDAFRVSSSTNHDRNQPIGLGSIWPVFIAGCEAIDLKRREAIVSWLDQAYTSCGLTPIATAKDIMVRLWARQDICLSNRAEVVESWIDLVRDERIWPLLC